jgi:hypothetical protein
MFCVAIRVQTDAGDCITLCVYLIDLIFLRCKWVGPGRSVRIATGYELDGPGIESRWGQDFLYVSRPAVGPTQPSVQWVPALSRG